MPRPMVLATAVPRKKAATKLKKAAQMTASLGESTRVETTVAMLFAASWKPFRKSKIRATTMVMTTSSTSTFTGTGSWMVWIRVNLGALQHDRFQYIGGVFGLISSVLEHLIQFLRLDELDRILLVLKKDGNGFAADLVGFILESVDFLAVLKHSIVLFQQRDSDGEFLRLQHDQTCQFSSSRRRLRNLVHHQSHRSCIDEIEDIIERRSQP